MHKTREFNGERFRHAHTYRHKLVAQRHARAARRNGKKARITPATHGHALWTRSA